MRMTKGQAGWKICRPARRQSKRRVDPHRCGMEHENKIKCAKWTVMRISTRISTDRSTPRSAPSPSSTVSTVRMVHVGLAVSTVLGCVAPELGLAGGYIPNYSAQIFEPDCNWSVINSDSNTHRWQSSHRHSNAAVLPSCAPGSSPLPIDRTNKSVQHCTSRLLRLVLPFSPC